MASIYESQGQQVALGGPAVSSGFNPVRVYDPSQQMLQATERQAVQQERNIENLSKFSTTLMTFAKERGVAYRKNEYNLALADVVNGTAEVNPNVVQQNKQQANLLQLGANADTTVAKQLTDQGNPIDGYQYKKDSPRISSWRRYYQAVATVQMAAGDSQAFFYKFLRDSNEQIPITQPDGSIKTIAPSQAKSRPELQAVWAVGTQKFINEYGLNTINPTVIGEFLSPKIMESRAAIMNDRMLEIVKDDKKQEETTFKVNTAKSANALGDPTLAQSSFTTKLNDAFRITGSWTEANDLVNEAYLSSFTRLSKQGVEGAAQAAKLLEVYKTLNYDPANPTRLGTVYDRYADEIDKAEDIINKTGEETTLQEEATIDARIEDIVGTAQVIAESGSLAESQRAFDEAERRLKELTGKANPTKLAAAMSTLSQRGRNYNASNRKRVQQLVDKKQISASEISILVNNNFLSASDGKDLMEGLPNNQDSEMINGLIGEFRKNAKGQALSTLGVAGVNEQRYSNIIDPLVNELTDELINKLTELQRAERQNGKTMTTASLRQAGTEFIRQELIGNSRFAIKKDSSGAPTLPNLRGALPFAKNAPNNGPSGSNLSNQIVSRLPAVASAKRDQFNKEEIERNIEALNNGGQASDVMAIYARAANVPIDSFIKAQASRFKIPYTPTDKNKAAKTYANNLKIDPTAANILANPRSSQLQRSRARTRLQAATERQEFTPGSTSSATFGPNDYGGLLRLVSSGEGGYDSVNRGTVGDTPGGMKLTSMRLGDVQQLQKKFKVTNGREGVAAVGVAQWMHYGQLDLAIKAAGLGPNDLMSPANQQKMFWAYLTNTDKRPALRDYLLGKSNDLYKAHEDLADEFAAVKRPSGVGRYDDDIAGNKATINQNQIAKALRLARQAIMAQQQR